MGFGLREKQERNVGRRNEGDLWGRNEREEREERKRKSRLFMTSVWTN